MPWLRNTPSHPAVLGGIEYIVSIFIDHVGTFHWKFKLQLGSFGQSPSPLPSCDIWCWITCSFQNWKTISIVLVEDGIKSNPNILMASWNVYSSQVHLASYQLHTRYLYVAHPCGLWATIVSSLTERLNKYQTEHTDIPARVTHSEMKMNRYSTQGRNGQKTNVSC